MQNEEMKKLGNSLVCQSNKLIEASYRLRIGQQKFLRLMASMVKRDDEDLKSYEFKIADVMDLFDTKNQSCYVELDKQLRELMGNVLTFYIGKRKIYVPMLVLADQEPGTGVLKVQFHPVLKPLYLNLNKENPFTMYELSNALRLRSIYSLRMYELLKQYQKVGWRKLTIEEMREMFQLELNEYSRYNDFKRKVIIQAQKEINEKTDISFDYEEIKTSRKVTAIRFIIKPQKGKIPKSKAADQENFDGELAIAENQIDLEETLRISEVREFIEEDIKGNSILNFLKDANNDIDMVREAYKDAIDYLSDGKQIKSSLEAIIRSAIAARKDGKGWGDGTKQIKKQPLKNQTTGNSNKRQYDVDQLEKQLLGRS